MTEATLLSEIHIWGPLGKTFLVPQWGREDPGRVQGGSHLSWGGKPPGINTTSGPQYTFLLASTSSIILSSFYQLGYSVQMHNGHTCMSVSLPDKLGTEFLVTDLQVSRQSSKDDWKLETNLTPRIKRHGPGLRWSCVLLGLCASSNFYLLILLLLDGVSERILTGEQRP